MNVIGEIVLNYYRLKKTSLVSSYARQEIDDDDINAIVKVLKSDYITQGPALPEFEKNAQLPFPVSMRWLLTVQHLPCTRHVWLLG